MLVDELYSAMLEVEHCARRNQIPGPLARIAQKSLDLWRTDMGAARWFASMVLAGPTDLRVTTGQLPEPSRTACLRLVLLLESLASGEMRHELYLVAEDAIALEKELLAEDEQEAGKETPDG